MYIHFRILILVAGGALGVAAASSALAATPTITVSGNDLAVGFDGGYFTPNGSVILGLDYTGGGLACEWDTSANGWGLFDVNETLSSSVAGSGCACDTEYIAWAWDSGSSRYSNNPYVTPACPH